MLLIYEEQTREILAEVHILVRKHRPSTSNEVLAQIAWEAYSDACDGWDVPLDARAFDAAFPTLAGAL